MRGAASVLVHAGFPWIPSVEGLHTWGRLKKMGSVVGLKTPEGANTPRSPNPQARWGKKISINKKQNRDKTARLGHSRRGEQKFSSDPGTGTGLDHDIIG